MIAENMLNLNQMIDEFCDAFENPAQWTVGSYNNAHLQGSDRPNVFHLDSLSGLDEIASQLEKAQIRNIVLIGITPVAFSAGMTLQQRNFNVALIASGLETASVQTSLQKNTVASFFDRSGITFHPRIATLLKGSQVHCQSGYCGFVCEGRFITESAAVGCIVTAGGNIYADAVIICHMPERSQTT